MQFDLIDDGDSQRLLVRLDESLDRTALKSLSALGVRKRRLSLKKLTRSVSCWPEILPLVTAETSASDKTAVLFEIPAGDSVGEVISEVLRLGNDRQSFRVLGNGDEQRVLLRVVGPPYYSLLRALDAGFANDRSVGTAHQPREEGQHTLGSAQSTAPSCDSRITAFIEQLPRVWIEIGATHPLAKSLKPPSGKLLLIRRQSPWQLITEVPFRDIYETLELQLPDQPVEIADTEFESKLTVPLRLVRGGSSDIAELWVLRGSAADQLDEFVRTSDERLINRLSFAVGKDTSGDESIIVRLRPSREAPPVLVLEALSCEPFLKLPNLFVPSGHRIHPPLRRDVVKSLLADSPSQITWLEPSSDDPQGFTPRTIADAAFRPLGDWVDYVLDREHQPLEAWMQSSRFDFESFVCPDEKPDRPKKKKAAPKPKKSDEDDDSGQLTASATRKSARKKKAARKGSRSARTSLTETKATPRRIAELEKRLRELEAAFMASDLPLDDPEREPMWIELARTNSELKLNSESAICWARVFWEQEETDADLIDEWFEVESRSWPQRDGLLNDGQVAETLDRLLSAKNPSPVEMETLGAWLVLKSAEEQPSPEVTARLGKVQHHLERFEAMLPIRAAWLAWVGYVKLSHGDMLALARSRDRLLERLFQHGLMPDRDVPSFLRARGMQAGDRFRAVRDKIVDLRPLVKKWSKKNRKTAAETTEQYIDLIFAYALARLGEATAGLELLNEVTDTFGSDDAIHNWAIGAYGHRVKQAVDGRGTADALPDEVMAQLDELGRLDRYKLDRLRQQSNVIEPLEKVDPFRRWHQRFNDDLSRELAAVADARDREEITTRLKKLLDTTTEPDDRQKVVITALQVGPRLGEVVAREIIEEAFALLDDAEVSVLDQAMLLEGGLFLAAHFDQMEAVSRFVERLHELLESQKDIDTETIQTLQTLLTQSFRGMRKLGMRDNIARLLDQMASLVRAAQGNDKATKKNAKEEQAAMLTAMLQVASGWFYFGQNETAWAVMDEVRELLFTGELPAVIQKKLACAYAAALGQAPVGDAIPRFQQMFQKLKGIQDSFTTNTHFALSHLDLIESVLLAMVSDDFTMNEAGRRWLDDDEFLIRRRIHQDVREVMQDA